MMELWKKWFAVEMRAYGKVEGLKWLPDVGIRVELEITAWNWVKMGAGWGQGKNGGRMLELG